LLILFVNPILMEHQINFITLNTYAEKLARKYSDAYFSSSITSVSGSQILKFTKIELVDLFTIKILFEKWKAETDAIKSPYFNYSSEEVKEALAIFMAVLSKNIQVNKEHFLPLLTEAITHSLYFILAPLGYLKEFVLDPQKNISNEDLKDLQKYFKVHKTLINGIFTQLMVSNPSDSKRLEMADKIYKDYEEKADNAEHLLAMFADVIPVKINDLVISEEKFTELKSEIKPMSEPLPEISLEDLTPPSESLAEKNKKNKILDFKSALSINQRYMFVKELFQNKQDQFDEALSSIENCLNYEEAINLLIERYGEANNWDTDKEEVAELFELISKKFF
ncbi:MAG: hypothetical protein K2Q22_17605, partial [Cytophagales bacterium]|nr:hypothetical protein [Cytophagales bacterium]